MTRLGRGIMGLALALTRLGAGLAAAGLWLGLGLPAPSGAALICHIIHSFGFRGLARTGGNQFFDSHIV